MRKKKVYNLFHHLFKMLNRINDEIKEQKQQNKQLIETIR